MNGDATPRQVAPGLRPCAAAGGRLTDLAAPDGRRRSFELSLLRETSTDSQCRPTLGSGCKPMGEGALAGSGLVVGWDGRPATLSHLADISARWALDEQVWPLVFQDTLTGLANRRLLATG